MSSATKIAISRIINQNRQARPELSPDQPLMNGQRSAKQFILAPLPPEFGRFNPSLQELGEYFGEEWELNSGNPRWLANAIQMLCERKMMEVGITPPWFTFQAYCDKCGPILIAESHTENAFVACPWCSSSNGQRARYKQ